VCVVLSVVLFLLRWVFCGVSGFWFVRHENSLALIVRWHGGHKVESELGGLLFEPFEMSFLLLFHVLVFA
jgi:hypothetical protein